MNQFWKEVRLAGIMGLVVPGIVLGIASVCMDTPAQEQPMEIVTTQPAQMEERKKPMLSVLNENGIAAEMDLSDYLTGVVLAEMPASFETEALKAQSIVARTYAVRARERGGKHEGAAVCMSSACCQGYISESDYMDEGGTAENVEKVRSVVEDTAFLVLTYEGELIEATYFSCSGGSTEDAVAVWGTDVPYLQAVVSPGEEDAAYYSDTVTFSAERFAAALGLDVSGNPADWFGKTTYTAGGGVDTMTIGGEIFRGTTLRSALGLRSTAFTVSVSGDVITVNTRGFGHRVGMSQYGADAMAATGSSCEEILAYYYQGTELTRRID